MARDGSRTPPVELDPLGLATLGAERAARVLQKMRADEMRRRIEAGESQAEVARSFGVSEMTASRAVRGRYPAGRA